MAGGFEVTAVEVHKPSEDIRLRMPNIFDKIYEGETLKSSEELPEDVKPRMPGAKPEVTIRYVDLTKPVDYMKPGEKENAKGDGDDGENDADTYERDDNGTIFKTNRELNPNTEYTIGGVVYKTDGQGRIISCDGNVRQTPEGERDQKAQQEVGGEDRKEGDQGAHIISRTLGGSKGIENLLPVRGTINNGPYKSMENEINRALNNKKDVSVHVDVKYDGDSKRPSVITVEHTIDGKKTVLEYDNDEGSTDLVDSVEDKVDKEQYNDLKQEIADVSADGGKISVIAVKTEYDGNGDVTKVTVITRDEITNKNEPRVILPKGDA